MVSRMARIVHMGKLGGYGALLDGALLELDGRMVWSSVEALSEAARRSGLALSDLVIDTSDRPSAKSFRQVIEPGEAPRRPGGLPLAA